jgi:hypothetical protein
LIKADTYTRLPGGNGHQEKHLAGTVSFGSQYLASGFTHASDLMVEIIPRMSIKSVVQSSHLPSEESGRWSSTGRCRLLVSRLPPGRILG